MSLWAKASGGHADELYLIAYTCWIPIHRLIWFWLWLSHAYIPIWLDQYSLRSMLFLNFHVPVDGGMLCQMYTNYLCYLKWLSLIPHNLYLSLFHRSSLTGIRDILSRKAPLLSPYEILVWFSNRQWKDLTQHQTHGCFLPLQKILIHLLLVNMNVIPLMQLFSHFWP